eukprot:236162-Chlamydomonas_euryale.AAC.1
MRPRACLATRMAEQAPPVLRAHLIDTGKEYTVDTTCAYVRGTRVGSSQLGVSTLSNLPAWRNLGVEPASQLRATTS